MADDKDRGEGAFGEQLQRIQLNVNATTPVLRSALIREDFDEEATFVLDSELLTVSVDGVALTDTGGTIRFASPTFSAMHGYTSGELQGRSMAELYSPNQRELGYKPFIAQVQQTGAHECELGHSRKDGAPFSAWLSGHRLFDERGEPSGLLFVARDLTEQVSGEDVERQQHESLRLVIDAIPDPFALLEVIVDRAGAAVDGRLLDVNQAFQEMTGLAAEHLLGRTLTEVLPEVDPGWLEAFDQVNRSGAPFRRRGADSTGVVFFRPWPGQIACLFHEAIPLDASEPGGGSGRKPPSELCSDEGEGGAVGAVRGMIAQLLDQLEAERATLAATLRRDLSARLEGLVEELAALRAALGSEALSPEATQLAQVATQHLSALGPPQLGQLRPQGFEGQGLLPALSWYADRSSEGSTLQVHVEGAPPRPPLPKPLEVALFRIAQTALDHIAYRGDASRAALSLREAEGAITLSISDDGTSGDDEGAPGLVSIREQAQALGGSFQRESVPGFGERLVITVSR